MTQEIKDKLEQAAAYHQGSGLDFMAGAQTILENPAEWGLASMVVVRQLEMETNIQHKEKTELQSQLSRYREALEDVDIELSHEGYANSSGEGVDKARTIIKEALKQ